MSNDPKKYEVNNYYKKSIDKQHEEFLRKTEQDTQIDEDEIINLQIKSIREGDLQVWN